MWEMLKMIEGFYHRVSRRIMGMAAHITTGGVWEWNQGVYTSETGHCIRADGLPGHI